MSRDQRRQDRRKAGRAGATPASRRTPVKARAGTGIPWVPVAVVAGTIAVVLLIAYLIIQAGQSSDTTDAATEAEQNSDPSLPGVFYPSQGRGHFPGLYSPDRESIPYCEGVRHSGEDDDEDASATPGSPTPTPTATRTPADADTTPDPEATPTRVEGCHTSNPPSSGEHLNAQRNVDLGNGVGIDQFPPQPDVYERDIVFPRDIIPHILEHAGVFVGYNCAEGDQACQDVVDDLASLVNDRIDNNDDRVVMGRFPDLPEGEIGLSSWTRVLNMTYEEYDRDLARDFIATHACRFDPEGFC